MAAAAAAAANRPSFSDLSRPGSAGVELISAGLLVYCMCVVPVQLSLWDGIGPCEHVPTWEMDLGVDIFFMGRGGIAGRWGEGGRLPSARGRLMERRPPSPSTRQSRFALAATKYSGNHCTVARWGSWRPFSISGGRRATGGYVGC